MSGGSAVLDPERARREARLACRRELDAWRGRGIPLPALEGQLIRPLLGRAAAGNEPHPRVAAAWLAVQLAHEASLHHDDVIDAAARRRTGATVAAARGIPAALIEGDHLLTAGYRVAASTGSLAFVEIYARAVERTVAGERRQTESRGLVPSRAEYEEMAMGKSGELIACAFAADAALRSDPFAAELYETGRRIGLWYQMLDDLLDYCSAAESGKAPFTDFDHRVWTWPLDYLPGRTWPASREELDAILAERTSHGQTPLARALAELESTSAAVLREVRRLLPADAVVAALLAEWLERARVAVAASEPGHVQSSSSGAPARATPSSDTPPPALPADLDAFFARNSRSFSFAARLFPPDQRRRIADLYAFCRATDDLVDRSASPAEAADRLVAWEARCRVAYELGGSGVPVLDRVMREAAQAGVPFSYVRELLAGMWMDVEQSRYQSIEEMLTYAYRVASIVGLWLTRLWGVSDPRALARAADLGRAMQITNILRDVGEDWRSGRVYLPRDLLLKHGIDDHDLARMCDGGQRTPAYHALLEELMALADEHYARASEGVPLLPGFARRPVAVAAAVYQGIHDQIRANGYDNFTRRAATSLSRKVRLAAVALWRLERSTRRVGSARGTPTRQAAVVAALCLIAAPAAAQSDDGRPAATFSAPSVAPPSSTAARLTRMRALYLAAVTEQDSVAAAATVIQEAGVGDDLAVEDRALVAAYDGSLQLLRAKHGWWPPARWSAAQRGLRLLDSAVAAAPANVEVRYLRLVSGFHLPGIFDRDAQVREDFSALAELLLAGGTGPDALLREGARFVLAHGTLAPELRARLESWEARLP